jgi:hypothetical protein
MQEIVVAVDAEKIALWRNGQRDVDPLAFVSCEARLYDLCAQKSDEDGHGQQPRANSG